MKWGARQVSRTEKMTGITVKTHSLGEYDRVITFFTREHGLVRAGDQLTHQRKRTGQTFHATVTSGGGVKLPNGPAFSAPSTALKACVGTEIDGWANWRHDRTGKTLRELRDELSG